MPAQVSLVPGKPSNGMSRMSLTPLPQTWCAYCSNLGCYATHGRKVCGMKFLSAWLTSVHPRSGYHQSAKNIITATRKIIHGIKTEIPELYILGNPPVSVVAFGAKEGSGVNVLKVGDTMSRKGWHFAALQKPAAVHISVTVRTSPRPRRTFL